MVSTFPLYLALGGCLGLGDARVVACFLDWGGDRQTTYGTTGQLEKEEATHTYVRIDFEFRETDGRE